MSEPLTHRTVIAPAFLPGQEGDAPDVADPAAAPPGEGYETPPRPAPGEPIPPGARLAGLLAGGLRGRGWAVDYRWTTFQGHAFDARRGEHRYDVEVDLLDQGDDRQGRWAISAKRRTGFFKKIFQGGVDPAEHEMLRRSIDEILAADARTVGPATWVDEASFQR